MLGQRRDLALRAAGGDDHVIGDAGFAGEVDDDDVLGLVVVERLERERRAAPGRGGSACGGFLALRGAMAFTSFAVLVRLPRRRLRIAVAELGSSCIRQERPGGRCRSPARRRAAAWRHARSGRSAAPPSPPGPYDNR